MKKIKYSTFLLTVLITVSSIFNACKKDDNVASKATFLPNISIKGDDLIFVFKGDTYTEPGAEASENGVAIDYTIDGEVEVDIAGAYVLDYLAVNVDGFKASDSRTVVVVDTSNGLNSIDISGNFTRDGQAGSLVTWTKSTELPYTYIANNPGGVPPSSSAYPDHNAAVYKVFNVAVGVVAVPLQTTETLAPFSCESASGDPIISFNTDGVSGDVAYVWTVLGANFGTAPRTFRKL